MPSPDPLLVGEKRKITRLRRDLLGWAKENGRTFPWRRCDASEYQRIVVEVLLQRTTAAAVAGFFDAFVEKYRGWDQLALAEPADLEEFLRPLGLWRRRAQSLVGLAKYAAANGGRFPNDPVAHRDIPAVGQYVSNAILVFQHGKTRPLLDVNMARVIERFVRPRRLADIRHDLWLQEASYWYARDQEVAGANWAMLDFAALVCKARNPACLDCPVKDRCNWGKQVSK